MDDYSSYPESLTERRAESAAEWTPRDALINMLREIDKGEHPDLDCIVIGWRSKDPTVKGATRTGYSSAGPDVHTTLGVLHAVMMRMWNEGNILA